MKQNWKQIALLVVALAALAASMHTEDTDSLQLVKRRDRPSREERRAARRQEREQKKAARKQRKEERRARKHGSDQTSPAVDRQEPTSGRSKNCKPKRQKYQHKEDDPFKNHHGSPQTGDSFVDACLDYHTQARAEVGLPPLTWNKRLARHAQDTIDKMSRSDSGINHDMQDLMSKHEGENLSWASGGNYTPESWCKYGVKMWWDEKEAFEGKESGITGHYTQMVWRETTEVGCAIAQSHSGGWYLSCRYTPQGNVNGRRPY